MRLITIKIFNRSAALVKRLTYCRVRHNDHYVGVCRKAVNVGGEHGVAHFHTREVRRHFAATQLELLYDVADLLEPMRVRVRMRPVLAVGNNLDR